MHRALAHFRLGPMNLVIAIFLFVFFTSVWLAFLPRVCRFWDHVLVYGIHVLPLRAGLGLAEYHLTPFPPLRYSLPSHGACAPKPSGLVANLCGYVGTLCRHVSPAKQADPCHVSTPRNVAGSSNGAIVFRASTGAFSSHSRQLYGRAGHGGNSIDIYCSLVVRIDLLHFRFRAKKFLALNKNALERVTGKPVAEYSAPNGNQPPWVTHWLEAHGFVAYYFTGDTGMGPTQGYRNGEREARNVWAFPILHLDRAAGFEELSSEGYSNEEIARWLAAITEFTSDQRSVRLVYFHPPGILQYHDLVDRWVEQTARLKADGRFRWYTMTELANFLNSRKQVKWKVADTGGLITVEATHPQTLDHETWKIPASRFAQPRIIEGSAKVVRDNDAWRIIGGEGKNLRFETETLTK